MDVDLSQFREVFLAECAEHAGVIEEGLLELQHGEVDRDGLSAIFRAAHSMKGAAGTFGWTGLVQLTHAMEDLLDHLRSGRTEVTPLLVRLLLEALDEMKVVMGAVRDEEFGGQLSPRAESLVEELRRFTPVDTKTAVPSSTKVSTAAAGNFAIRLQPGADCFKLGIDPLSILAVLSTGGTLSNVEVKVDRLPRLRELDPEQCYLGWCFEYKGSLTEGEVRTILEAARGQTTLQKMGQSAVSSTPPVRDQKRTPAVAEIQSIRVPSSKVDQLIDLAGELVIAYSMANEVLTHFTPESLPRLKDALAAMERGTRELQERVLSVRMTPAGSLFHRFPRLIYDVAAQTGKKIQLVVSGEDTELDKVISDQLADPLTHLVRNSADHGIEEPSDRIGAGKPETGTVTLRAYHQSGEVVIEISDDGRGLDSGRIREKAVSRGLIAKDAQLTESEIHQLIFAPGFSTREQVSDLSGRGVGMDVVKRNVESLNGSIRLDSVPGQGMTVRLFVPLTLAIVDGLLLRVGDQSFALPIASIIENVRPKGDQILTIPGGCGSFLMVRNESLPLVELNRLFNIAGAGQRPERRLAVIVNSGRQKLALLVDDIIGQQQFVIKSVETNFRRVEGAMGATILGDGRVALIVDVPALASMAARSGMR